MKNKLIIPGVLIFFAMGVIAQEQKGMVSTCSMSIESANGSGFVCMGEPITGLLQQQDFVGLGFNYLIFELSTTSTVETLKAFSSLPNPFDDVIHVDIEDNSRDRFLIRVINNTGRLIDEREQPAQFTYDLGFLSPGIYGLLVHDMETKMLLGKRKIVKR